MAPRALICYDADGKLHEIVQAEGGEQGDPLMPAVFALGQHGSLLQAPSSLEPGGDLLPFLDDVYVTCPSRLLPRSDRGCTSKQTVESTSARPGSETLLASHRAPSWTLCRLA